MRRVHTIAVALGLCAAAAVAAGPDTRPAADRVIEAAATRPAGTLPVRWTVEVPMAAVDWPDVAKLLARKVDIHTDDRLVMVKGEDAKSPVTGADYLKLRDAGYEFKTNYDNMKESWFKSATLPPQWLSRCKPARQSFVRDFDPAKDPRGTLAILPAGLGFGPVGNHGSDLWLTAFPKSTAKATDGPRDIVVEDHDGGETYLQVLAWGDADSDGVEDCLLYVANCATGGTYKAYRYVAVTRRAANEPLVVLTDAVR